MLSSRGLAVIKAAKLLKQNSSRIQPVRHSGNAYYRSGPSEHPKHIIYGAEFVGAVMWWWVLWHLWTEPGHVLILGENVPITGAGRPPLIPRDSRAIPATWQPYLHTTKIKNTHDVHNWLLYSYHN